MDDVVEGLEVQAEALEKQLDRGQPKQLNAALADLRRTFIGLRRYLIPQRDALLRLAAAKVSWMHEDDRARLREVAEQTTRMLEALEAARDQAAVTQEELLQRLFQRAPTRPDIAVLLATGIGANLENTPGGSGRYSFSLSVRSN